MRGNARRMILRGAFAAALALALATALGCNESPADQLFTPSVTTIFAPSATTADPDWVLLRGEVVDNQTVLLDVVIAGPSTSGDLYSFAFDLVFSGTVIPQYVANSVEAGPALTPLAGQTVTVQAAQNGDRITIGVTKTGGGDGNGVGAGETLVVRLRVTLPGAGRAEIRFEGDPGGGGPAALDSTGAVVPSVLFDSQPALIDRPV